VPDSITREPSSTTMKSAMRTEEGDPAVESGPAQISGAAGSHRSRIPFEQGVFGLGIERRGRLIEHEKQREITHKCPCQRELLPLPEAQVDAPRPGWTELGLEPGDQLGHNIFCARASHGSGDGGCVIESCNITQSHGVAHPELESEEVLKRSREAGSPEIRR